MQCQCPLPVAEVTEKTLLKFSITLGDDLFNVVDIKTFPLWFPLCYALVPSKSFAKTNPVTCLNLKNRMLVWGSWLAHETHVPFSPTQRGVLCKSQVMLKRVRSPSHLSFDCICVYWITECYVPVSYWHGTDGCISLHTELNGVQVSFHNQVIFYKLWIVLIQFTWLQGITSVTLLFLRVSK